MIQDIYGTCGCARYPNMGSYRSSRSARTSGSAAMRRACRSRSYWGSSVGSSLRHIGHVLCWWRQRRRRATGGGQGATSADGSVVRHGVERTLPFPTTAAGRGRGTCACTAAARFGRPPHPAVPRTPGSPCLDTRCIGLRCAEGVSVQATSRNRTGRRRTCVGRAESDTGQVVPELDRRRNLANGRRL